MNDAEEVSEEGFGGFRDTWYIGRVTRADAEAMLREEAELMRIVDTVAATAEEFEELASAIEGWDIESLPEPLREAALKEGLAAVVDGEIAPLDGLEIGVAGLAYALGVAGCDRRQLPLAQPRSQLVRLPRRLLCRAGVAARATRRTDRRRRLRTRCRSGDARDLRAVDCSDACIRRADRRRAWTLQAQAGPLAHAIRLERAQQQPSPLAA